MRRISRKTLVVGGAAVAIVAAAGGTALAYWTSTGSGSGSALTSSGGSSITVTDDGGSGPAMAPGVAPERVTATIENTAASGSAYVNSLKVTIGSISAANCASSDYQLSVSAPSGAYTTSSTPAGTQTITVPVNTELPAAGGNVTVGFYIGFVDSTTTDQSGCEGVTAPLTYSTD